MSKHAKAPRVAVPESEMTWRFSRSSGPGGQSVNTTDSRVELLWRLADTAVLTDEQKALATTRLRGRLVDGAITITASQYKSQHRNREAAKVRLESLLAQALVPPRPRRATKPSRAARQRRLDDKKQRGQTKRLRQRPE
ncbi:MAG: aminoacyl-tRNA hydrolase [Actinomycetota bacterium]|nr:aminoacyl-tRNA hydrolase [Actinomycetota bacterium]